MIMNPSQTHICGYSLLFCVLFVKPVSMESATSLSLSRTLSTAFSTGSDIPAFAHSINELYMPDELKKKMTLASAKDALKLLVSLGVVAEGSISLDSLALAG